MEFNVFYILRHRRNIVFIDEDINRIGRSHLGLPIKDIKEVVENHPIVIPMKPDLAKLLAKRLGMNKYNFILPDQLYLN